MAASPELRATLTALSERAEEIRVELSKLAEKVNSDPTIERDYVLETCHALRAEMIRLRKRINEITSAFEGPSEGLEEFSNTNPFGEPAPLDDGIKSG
jgi:hypothetical protein